MRLLTPALRSSCAPGFRSETRRKWTSQWREDVHTHIEALVAEEHRLWEHESSGNGSESDRRRLAEIKVELDRYWDLLRRRRSAADAGGDPDERRAAQRGHGRGLPPVATGVGARLKRYVSYIKCTMATQPQVREAAEADAAPARRGGRPRSTESEQAILQATRELLVEARRPGPHDREGGGPRGRREDDDLPALARQGRARARRRARHGRAGRRAARARRHARRAAGVRERRGRGARIDADGPRHAGPRVRSRDRSRARAGVPRPRRVGARRRGRAARRSAGSRAATCGPTPMPRPPTSCSSGPSTTGSC